MKVNEKELAILKFNDIDRSVLQYLYPVSKSIDFIWFLEFSTQKPPSPCGVDIRVDIR